MSGPVIGFSGRNPRTARTPGAENASQEGASFFPLARYCIRCTPGIGAQTTIPPYRGRFPPVNLVAFSAPGGIMPRIGAADKERRGQRLAKDGEVID